MECCQTQLPRVAPHIAIATDKSDYEWEFTGLQGKEINDFALASGKVALWEKISEPHGDKSPEVLSTHLGDATKINQLKIVCRRRSLIYAANNCPSLFASSENDRTNLAAVTAFHRQLLARAHRFELFPEGVVDFFPSCALAHTAITRETTGAGVVR